MYAYSNAWITITNGYPNNNTDGYTNKYTWIVPGPPSGTVTVRVEAVGQVNLNAEAGPFTISGIQLQSPVPSAMWDLTATNRVTWLNYDGLGSINIQVSYNGGSAYETLTNNLFSQNGLNFFDIPPGVF